ncbi:MAG: hypothetical protein J6Y91_04655 [Alphaproteobacteria bacterium]|nr:hypothetical protein [Alphaproteobacteria bacterium]
MPQYRPTVYEQIVEDYLSQKKMRYEDYAEELAARGWKDKRYYDAYIKDIEYITKLMDKPDFNLRAAADEVKAHHPSANKDVLRFSLTESEKKIVLDAEAKGMMKDGEVIRYDGYDREIVCADSMKLPDNADAFVIFSGHPGSAEAAIESWFEDFRRTGEPKKMIFLGLYDNQGNTSFANESLRFNTGSEVEMYVRYCREVGVPNEIINECLVKPTDTSTEENISLLAEIRNKYFDKNRDVNFVMFGYPAYQKRIASEFAFGFQKMEKNPNKDERVAPTNFIMPVVKTEQNPRLRYLSYDDLDGIAQDIIVGNCLAHPYRVSAGGRFDSKLGKYPEKLKPLLPISLVYSYPNVANELAGTDTKTGTVMKLLRAVQHRVYGWEDPKRVDSTMMYNVTMLRKRLARKGLLSAEVAFHGNDMKTETAKAKLLEHFKKKDTYLDAAQVLMGSEKVHPRKLQGVIEYFKNEEKARK